MPYQCHKCKKEFVQRTDFKRHMDRTIDCLNVPLEDRVASKVFEKLKNEINISNINIIDKTK